MSSDIRSLNREHFYDPDRRNLAYAERRRLLRLLTDLDPKTGIVREGKTYDAPIGGWREEARKCSHCKGLTNFTTPRGRSVHPTCEGWVDDLSDLGWVEVTYAVASVLGVKSVEVVPA